VAVAALLTSAVAAAPLVVSSGSYLASPARPCASTWAC
jgi:hypothetical protein